MIRILFCLFFSCFISLVACTRQSSVGVKHALPQDIRSSSSRLRREALSSSHLSPPSQNDLAKHSLMFLLTGSGNHFTVLGSALSIDALGHLLTTAAVVTDNATHQPFSRVFIAERNLDTSSFFECTAVGIVEQYAPQKHIAIIKPIAPLQSDCTQESNLLDEWNKFSFFESKRIEDLTDGMHVQLLGFTPAPTYDRVFSPARVGISHVSDTGAVVHILSDFRVHYAFSPLFVFDMNDAFTGMLDFRYASDLSSTFFIPAPSIAEVNQ